MLNQINLSNCGFFKATLTLIIIALFINLSCGKRKPPQPPIERISQRVEITGIQRGNLITISWTLPSQNVAGGSTLNISRADVYRLAEPLNSSLALSEEEFASRSTLISSLPISEEDFRRSQLNFSDTLAFGGQSVRLRYAIRLVNASGQKAAFSNFLLIEPTAKVAASPVLVTAEVSEEAIKLTWKNPAANVDGSTPPNILGFNVYRKSSENIPAVTLNVAPITENTFYDRLFEFGKSYEYYVRTVSLGGNGEPVESLESNLLNILPQDIFPPSAPSAITIAAAPGTLSIFFAVNPEKDLAGYRLYRSIDRTQPLPDWTLLTNELLTKNTFQDINVETGKTYFYYLTAVDKVGNTSEVSEIVSETAP